MHANMSNQTAYEHTYVLSMWQGCTVGWLIKKGIYLFSKANVEREKKSFGKNVFWIIRLWLRLNLVKMVPKLLETEIPMSLAVTINMVVFKHSEETELFRYIFDSTFTLPIFVTLLSSMLVIFLGIFCYRVAPYSKPIWYSCMYSGT